MTVRPFITLLSLILLGGCADLPTPEQRLARASAQAQARGMQLQSMATDSFDLAAFIPAPPPNPPDVLTVYIEGDGFAWIDGATPSSDPTPMRPIALELALRQPDGTAAYLARPCQFVGGAGRNCSQAYWTAKRFAPEVIAATMQALDEIETRLRVHKLILVGYSGGGAVAALVAARRHDVVFLATVAGNLDHVYWTGHHHINPLSGSLNPADEWLSLQRVPQLHFVGAKDEVVELGVANSYVQRFPKSNRPEIRVVEDIDHRCCWADRWPMLYKKMLSDGRFGKGRPADQSPPGW